jgi:hypothetical protein
MDSVRLDFVSLDSARIVLSTALWTAIWAAALPRLSRRAELAAGLIPFAAFGLRVFAGFFADVPPDDPVRAAVAPLVDWVAGRTGVVPYQVVLDATVALGLVWLASAFDIPRQSRIATAWLMPAVAASSLASRSLAGLPLEHFLAATVPSPGMGMAAGGLIAAVIWLTPGPIAASIRGRAAIVAAVTVPLAVAAAECLGPTPRTAATASSLSLAAGAAAGLVAWWLGGFQRPRSRLFFAMAVGVAVGSIVAAKPG